MDKARATAYGPCQTRKPIQAFHGDRPMIYRLRSPQQTPCTLGESHRVNGVWQSATLIHGPWDTSQEHARVTTWRELPGQAFHPDVQPDVQSVPSQDLEVRVDDLPALGTLHRGPETRRVEVAVGEHKILVAGRGAIGNLALETVDDIVPLIDARRAHVESCRRRR
ncbi:hypothetical protein PV682_39080 [Streptomyces niveiscabiei]|uniref:hypothetical protein n=1 Tax=Streptomyces niveiscabiei TaxID=164115 RepID=UPI0029A5FF50|nr:hypothetical protein [Streptomyces niveiscabiei]MDX3387406.1 hypothetical protein [Streptomyces niveiscabiei]